jgi:hypothetical protein
MAGNPSWRENSGEIVLQQIWHIDGHQDSRFFVINTALSLYSAKPKHRPKNRRLSPLSTNFCKNRRRLIVGDLKAVFQFFCFDFLHIDHSNDFCFCKFFAKGLK